ncbi:MAG: beta-ketoacyl-ACP synthase [Gammaproteobacteria bacterium]|nr:beta-ketoacyl-ACP synthase [Gammaproteobacteria bacterium]
MTKPDLAIGPYTLTSAFGCGRQATRAALRAGRSALRPYESAQVFCHVGEVADLAQLSWPAAFARYDCRNNRLALASLEADGFSAAVAALRARLGAGRIGCVMGTSTSGIGATEAAYRALRAAGEEVLPASFPYRETHNIHSVGDFVHRWLGLKGPAFTVSTACSSSAKVFGAAARLIASGTCTAVVVGGVDSLCATTIHGFAALQLLSTRPARPFSADRDGISVGEAAGFAIVAPRGLVEDATFRLCGIGDSSDAYHMTAPHPHAAGAISAMTQALARARLAPADLDYIHLHGTGTVLNDAAEDLALASIGATAVPASSLKGALGHTLGAAGLAGVVLTAEAMAEGLIPATTNTHTVDPLLRCAIAVAPGRRTMRRALINAFGFGGSNSTLIIESIA